MINSKIAIVTAIMLLCLCFIACKDNKTIICPCPEPLDYYIHTDLNYNYNNIMDTLKGEWIWTNAYPCNLLEPDTLTGKFKLPFKSVIKFLGQSSDSSIHYEVYFDDKLFSKGKFKIRWAEKGYTKTGHIALPHINNYGFYDFLDGISYGQDVWVFDFYRINCSISCPDYDPDIFSFYEPDKDAIWFISHPNNQYVYRRIKQEIK